MRSKIAIVLAILGLVVLGLGIGQRTIWLPPATVTAGVEGTVAPAPVTVIGPEVLKAKDGHFTMTIKAKGPIQLAVAQQRDVTGWVGAAAHTTVTGVNGDFTALATESKTGAKTVPNPAGSDMWVSEEKGTGELSYTWQAPGHGDWALLVSSDGTAPAPTDISLTTDNDAGTPWAVPLMIIGSALLALAALLFWIAPRKPAAAVAGRRSAGRAPSDPATGAVEVDKLVAARDRAAQAAGPKPDTIADARRAARRAEAGTGAGGVAAGAADAGGAGASKGGASKDAAANGRDHATALPKAVLGTGDTASGTATTAIPLPVVGNEPGATSGQEPDARDGTAVPAAVSGRAGAGKATAADDGQPNGEGLPEGDGLQDGGGLPEGDGLQDGGGLPEGDGVGQDPAKGSSTDSTKVSGKDGRTDLNDGGDSTNGTDLNGGGDLNGGDSMNGADSTNDGVADRPRDPKSKRVGSAKSTNDAKGKSKNTAKDAAKGRSKGDRKEFSAVSASEWQPQPRRGVPVKVRWGAALAAVLVAGTMGPAVASDPTTPASGPTASSTASGSAAATASSTAGATATGAATAGLPVLLDSQVQRIAAAVSTVVTSGDNAKNSKELQSRVAGMALQVRAANYKIRSTVSKQAAVDPVNATPLLARVVTTDGTWPRSAMIVTKGDGNALPQLLTLVQASARENYKLVNATPLLPGQTFPTVEKEGSASVPLDSSTGLQMSPKDAMAALSDRLTKADSKWKSTFKESVYISSVMDTQAKLLKDAKDASYVFSHTADLKSALAMRTADGGAMVVVGNAFGIDATSKADATLTIGADAAVFAGGTETTKGFVLNYAEPVVMYIPPASAKGQISIISANRSLVGAKFK